MQCDSNHEFAAICQKHGGAALGGAQLVLRNESHSTVGTMDGFLCGFMALYPDDTEKFCYGSTWLRNAYAADDREPSKQVGIYRLEVELVDDELVVNGGAWINTKLLNAVRKMASMAATEEFARKWLNAKHHPCCSAKDGKSDTCDCGVSDFITTMKEICNNRSLSNVAASVPAVTTINNSLAGIDIG